MYMRARDERMYNIRYDAMQSCVLDFFGARREGRERERC